MQNQVKKTKTHDENELNAEPSSKEEHNLLESSVFQNRVVLSRQHRRSMEIRRLIPKITEVETYRATTKTIFKPLHESTTFSKQPNSDPDRNLNLRSDTPNG